MDIPEEFCEFLCREYFNSSRFTKGVFSEPEQLFLVVPVDQVLERTEYKMLVIGRPGVDGIEFGYRRGLEGIWAYYPYGNEFTLVAPTIEALVDGWLNGSIKV
ncbi:MAG: hypothetical protein ACAI34_11880 [Verrucomicrobium sp.]